MLVIFQVGGARNNSQRLASVLASTLGHRGTGRRPACRQAGSGAICICFFEACTSNFAVAAAIRARRAFMLASAAKRVSSSLGFAWAILRKILEDIVADLADTFLSEKCVKKIPVREICEEGALQLGTCKVRSNDCECGRGRKRERERELRIIYRAVAGET